MDIIISVPLLPTAAALKFVSETCAFESEREAEKIIKPQTLKTVTLTSRHPGEAIWRISTFSKAKFADGDGDKTRKQKRNLTQKNLPFLQPGSDDLRFQIASLTRCTFRERFVQSLTAPKSRIPGGQPCLIPLLLLLLFSTAAADNTNDVETDVCCLTPSIQLDLML